MPKADHRPDERYLRNLKVLYRQMCQNEACDGGCWRAHHSYQIQHIKCDQCGLAFDSLGKSLYAYQMLKSQECRQKPCFNVDCPYRHGSDEEYHPKDLDEMLQLVNQLFDVVSKRENPLDLVKGFVRLEAPASNNCARCQSVGVPTQIAVCAITALYTTAGARSRTRISNPLRQCTSIVRCNKTNMLWLEADNLLALFDTIDPAVHDIMRCILPSWLDSDLLSLNSTDDCISYPSCSSPVESTGESGATDNFLYSFEVEWFHQYYC